MGFFDWLTGANKTQQIVTQRVETPAQPLPTCPTNPGVHCNYHFRAPFDPGHHHPFCSFGGCVSFHHLGRGAGWRRLKNHSVSPSHKYCNEHAFFEGKPICQREGCSTPVSRHEFTLCLRHWMQNQMQDKRMGKTVARRLNRKISPSKIWSYNRLIDTTSRYLRKPIEMCTDKEVAFSLIQNMHISPREASAFINSDAVKGLAGWLPRIDAHGQESEGFEWTDFQGGKWYRSLTEPGPWTRYGAATQPPQTQQQPQQQSYNPPTHQSDAQTVIQNITYNIQDSAISGDINANINRINDSEHQ